MAISDPAQRYSLFSPIRPRSLSEITRYREPIRSFDNLRRSRTRPPHQIPRLHSGSPMSVMSNSATFEQPVIAMRNDACPEPVEGWQSAIPHNATVDSALYAPVLHRPLEQSASHNHEPPLPTHPKPQPRSPETAYE